LKALAFVLRDHREELWRRWAESLDERVAPDYRKLISSPIGEKAVRGFVDDLCACSESEQYELPALLRRAEERAGADAAYRLALGFTLNDLVIALQTLRLAIVDVLLDALVLDELPSFTDTLIQLKCSDDLIDRLVCATVAAA